MGRSLEGAWRPVAIFPFLAMLQLALEETRFWQDLMGRPLEGASATGSTFPVVSYAPTCSSRNEIPTGPDCC